MSKHILIPLLKSFNVRPHNLYLYECAFTHPSINLNEHKNEDYQRLEFVGDSILGSIIATLSFNLHKDYHEGQLTRLRSSLVDTASLSKLALSYHFDKYIKVGQSFTQDVKNSPKILEDVFEAFIGAIYLDLGFKVAFRLVERIFKDRIIHFNYEDALDYKTKLQELLQADHHTDLEYRLLNKKGPANNPMFTIGLYYDGSCLGKGSGHSKKAAEQEAAKVALSKLATKR